MEHGNIFSYAESRSGSERLVGIASLCLTLNLAGFLVVSYVPGVLHINHRAATVPFRCLVLALSLYAVYKILAISHLRLAVSVTTLLAVVFWTLYVTRFISDTVLFPVSIGASPDDIALFLFGMCLPTFIAFYLFGEIHLYRKALVWSMLALGVCSAISMRLTQAQEDNAAGPAHGKRYSQPHRIRPHGINSHDPRALCPATNWQSEEGLDAQAVWRPRRFALERSTILAAVQPRRLSCSSFVATHCRVPGTAPRLQVARHRHLCRSLLCGLCG